MPGPTTGDCEPADVAKTPRQLFIGQNSMVGALDRPQPKRKLAEVHRRSHPLDFHLPCRMGSTETDERIKALSYQLHDMLVHQFSSRSILIDPIFAIK
jgi:hypothetical protein